MARGDKLPSFKRGDLDRLTDRKHVIQDDMLVAYIKYGGQVGPRVRALSDARIYDGAYHRPFCIIKAMLSAGFDLSLNIRAARTLTDLVMTDPDVDTESMILALIDAGVFQGRSPGQAVVNVHNALPWILKCTDGDMTYQNLREIDGVGPKIGSWALSLYYGVADRFTLDVHMFRGMFGTTRCTTDAIHEQLEQVLLQWCGEVLPGVPPLVIQWCMWCMYRGDSFDPHHGIVRTDY